MMAKCALITLMETGYPHHLFNSVLLSAISVMTVLLNLITIIAFAATKEAVKNTSNLLIFCVSFVDFTYGIAIMPLYVYVMNSLDSIDICIVVKILFAGGGSLGSSSAMLKALTAVDRFLHMNPNIQNQPTRLHRIFKISNIGYIVILVVLVASTISGLGTTLATSTSTMMIVLGPGVVLCITIYVSIVTGLYIKGYRRIRTFTEESSVYQECGEQPTYVKSLYKTVLVLVLLLCVSYIPYSIAQAIIYIIYSMNLDLNIKAHAYSIEILGLLAHTNYFTNCLAVLYFNKRAQSWIFKKFRIHAMQNDNHEIAR